MVKNECSNDVFDTLRSARLQLYWFECMGLSGNFSHLDAFGPDPTAVGF
jgi:hypothetical protein